MDSIKLHEKALRYVLAHKAPVRERWWDNNCKDYKSPELKIFKNESLDD